MEGAGLRIQKKEGAAWAEDYMREFKIEWVFNWAKAGFSEFVYTFPHFGVAHRLK